MSSESTGYHVLDQYRNICSKLKRRFLRKPNETEASESFASLGQECESQDLPQYAGISWMAAARCEGTLGHNVAEISHLLRSARQFFKSEENDFNIGCTSVSSENLEAGLTCMAHALTRYPEDSSIPIVINLEIAELLRKIGKTDSLEYLKCAVRFSEGKHDTKMYCLDLLASHFIENGDYLSALHSYQDIVNILENLPQNGHRTEVFIKCEINSVFLLLILRPSPQSISPNLAKILEKYTWGDENDPSVLGCHMSKNLFLLLQSLVITCQSLDRSSLEDIEYDFWPYLSSKQKDLLRILVKMYYV